MSTRKAWVDGLGHTLRVSATNADPTVAEIHMAGQSFGLDIADAADVAREIQRIVDEREAEVE